MDSVPNKRDGLGSVGNSERQDSRRKDSYDVSFDGSAKSNI